ncbi:Anaphase-promoting complex subunit 1 [Malassezia yamatoensis]|uniref:Anaphase-promoting complex subunit 1 n=1 Tax=Malassezia yamatoensis TaxID=253288 RepID=A0AAJ6CIL7_9BASI|nr:Anaphase-promoting complex subunit 1 [Malassezia yamatoensis]
MVQHRSWAREDQLARLHAMASADYARRPRCGQAEYQKDQLKWTGCKLEWSRGTQVYRTFSFQEEVYGACFAMLERNDHQIRRALCIALERKIHFVFACLGEEVIEPLYFPLYAMYAAQVGVVLIENTYKPRVYYVRSPLDNLAVWKQADAISMPSATTAATLHGRLRAFLSENLDESLVYVGEKVPIMVTVHSNTLSLYQYTCSSQPIAHKTSGPSQKFHTGLVVQPQRRSVSHRLSRRHSSNAARDADMHVLADLIHPSAEVAQHVVDVSSTPTAALLEERRTSSTRRRISRRSSLPAADRETSEPVSAIPSEDQPFTALAHAHAACALVDTIHVSDSAMLPPTTSVHCTLFVHRDRYLLYIAVPSIERVFVREVTKDGHVTLPQNHVHAVLFATKVTPVSLLEKNSKPDALLVHSTEQNLLHLGPPGKFTHILTVPDQELPRIRPTCSTTQYVLDMAIGTLPDHLASACLRAWAVACKLQLASDAQIGSWSTFAELCGVCNNETQSNDAYEAMCNDYSNDSPLNKVFEASMETQPNWCEPQLDIYSMALVLHFAALDTYLDQLRYHMDMPKIIQVLCRLCDALHWTSWLDFWVRRVGSLAWFPMKSLSTNHIQTPNKSTQKFPPPSPPDIHELLKSAMDGKGESLDNVLHMCAKACGITQRFATIQPFTTIAYNILTIYREFGQSLASNPASPRTNARNLVQAMLDTHSDDAFLARLPIGIAMPLHEAIRTNQLDPPKSWTPEAYRLVKRYDAAAQAQESVKVCTLSNDHSAFVHNEKLSDSPSKTDWDVSVNSLTHPYMPSDRLRTLPDGLDPLSALLFAHDYRLVEVARMLHTTHTNTAHIAHDNQQDELEHHAEVLQLARTLAERTMAQCIGRGMFRMASCSLRPTSTWRTPRLNLNLRTLPGAELITNPYAADPQEVDWAEFHNGVASALEIAVHTDDTIDSNWIFSHSTAQRQATRHAGFLLGLGLHGHLARLGRVHAYRYLTPRHTLTTIGLVLGIAASFLGTADPAARQLMAIQVAAFLPQKSAALQFPIVTQAAGMLGIGLVFCATDHHWSAERLLAQFDASPHEQDISLQDLYANSAGIALGWVLLGRAHRSSMDTAFDQSLMAGLRKWIVASDTMTPSTNRPAYAAMLALALIFLKSNNKDIAQLLAPPESAAALQFIRPDLLLIRSAARCLVLWEEISPDDQYLLSTTAPFMQTITPLTTLSTAELIAWYNLRAGACLALSIKFAGTANLRARAVLLRQLNSYVHDTPILDDSYDARIIHAARETLRDVLHVGLATVMAGTGDVELLRLYRMAHGATQRSYGSHMASHMALGLLFLGGGRLTLGTNDVCVAAMLTAFLPRYPASPSDSRAHLQAARHFYVLALAPRLLVATDIRSQEVCPLPVTIHLQNRQKTSNAFAPTLLPAMDDVHAVHSASRRYWPASLNRDQLGINVNDPRQILYFHVQRRTGYLSYTDDPRGHRSIFARSRGWAAHPFSASTDAEKRAMLRDLWELVASFDTAPHYATLVQRVCQGTSPFPVFCTSVLMECLTKDSPSMVGVYWSFYDARDKSDACSVQHWQFLQDFYKSHSYTALAQHREPLLSSAVRANLDACFLNVNYSELIADDSKRYLAADGNLPTLQHNSCRVLMQAACPSYQDLCTLRTHFFQAGIQKGTEILHCMYPQNPSLVQGLVHAWTSS